MTKIRSAIETDGAEEFSKTLKETSGNTLPLGLYVHVPFCKKKCPYCHFFVVKDEENAQRLYHKALLAELSLYESILGKLKLTSLYFGGGTPSRYTEIESFLQRLAPPSDIEITIEANPEDITLEKMTFFRQSGINRVSIGVQSFSDKELYLLGREHTAKKAREAVLTVSKAGFTSISIDLMYEIPSQTIASFEETLSEATSLPITHLSLYNLTIEENTAFYRKREAIGPLLPSSDEGGAMLDLAIQHLEGNSLKQYEISAFAKEGYQAVHNKGYWKGTPFIGIGPSAFSFLGGARYRNVCSMKKYSTLLEQGTFPVDFYEKLSPEASQAERLAVALRLFEGVDLSTYPSLSSQLQRELETLLQEGYLTQNSDTLKLSKKGRLFYDHVGSSLQVE